MVIALPGTILHRGRGKVGRRLGGGASALLLVGAGVLAVCLPARGARGAQTATATVVLVHDGATMAVETAEGVRITLHLLGITAPSLRDVRPQAGRTAVGQPFAAEAKRALEDLALKKEVRVIFHGRDAFRQVMAEVYVAGESVNVHMVRGGLARVDRAARRLPEALRQALEQAEAEARRAKRGLWMFE